MGDALVLDENLFTSAQHTQLDRTAVLLWTALSLSSEHTETEKYLKFLQMMLFDTNLVKDVFILGESFFRDMLKRGDFMDILKKDIELGSFKKTRSLRKHLADH